MKITLKELAPVIEATLQGGLCYTFSPAGDSMRPMLYRSGCTVTLKRPEFPLKKYDIPLYRNKDGNLVLHRIVKLTESGYVMRGDSTVIPEEGIGDGQIIGVVCAFTRGKRSWSVTSPLYRLYCRVWTALPFLRRFVILFGRKTIK